MRWDDGVSVVVTLYNYRKMISDCIRSFRSQRCNFPIEMIIADDGSTDGGREEAILESKKTGHRVHVIASRTNTGYASAKNRGIKSTSFGVLKMIDADDLLAPDCLQHGMNSLRVLDAEFVHGPCDKQELINGIWKDKGRHPSWSRWLQEKDGLNPWLGVHAQGTMYRKDLHRAFGLYDEKMRSKADREMWCRLCCLGIKLTPIEYTMAIYRQHKHQMSRSKLKKQSLEEIQAYFDRVSAVRRKGDLSGLEML
jgi:glycosyltransferase involved in cell wall biosynthesis